MASTPSVLLPALENLEERIAPATFLVTNTSDSGAGSLRDAVSQANEAPGADSIVFQGFVSSNTYEITLTSGEIDVKGPLTIKGPGTFMAISGNGTSRIFDISDGDNAVDSAFKMSGLTLIDGSSGADGGAIFSQESVTIENSVLSGNMASSRGGAIAVINAGAAPKLTLKNTSIIGNSSGSYGGGVYFYSDQGSALISKSFISKNTASNGAGGAHLVIGGNAGAKSSITIDSTVVSNNAANGANGGGLILENNAASGTGKVLVKKSQIDLNFAGVNGGGIHLDAGIITLDGSTIAGNSADAGGGISADGGITNLIVKNTKVTSNIATSTIGGGVLLDDVNAATFDKATISGNSSVTAGGGIGSTLSSFVVKGSVISGNATSGDGGGISSTGANQTVSILSSQITNNRDGQASGDNGGGIYFTNTSTLNLSSVTISGNVGFNGGGVFLGSTSSLFVTKSKFESNRAIDSTLLTAPGGGAILSQNSTAVSIIGSTFSDNSTWGDGGALTITANDSDVTLTKNRFVNNSAGDSGGAVFLGATGGSATLSSNTFLNNSGTNSGGAVFIDNTGVKTFIKNQIRNNAAQLGGGIAVGMGAGGITLTGDQITGNSAVVSGGGIRELGTVFNVDPSTIIRNNTAPLFPNVATV
ncbi:MAG: hypothetical protein Fur0032_04730 [Terrimicrobiaceae bacterium]